MNERLYPIGPDDGFIFAATGAQYRGLARRAARSLRAVMGDVQVDLFTDALTDDPIFDREHLVEHKGTRPKIEALRRSRFRHTVYLDCDVVVVADVSDMFAILRKADITGAHDMYGNGPVSLHTVAQTIPAGFRQINSGVLGVTRSDETQVFLTSWERRMHDEEQRWDQPVLRELLWDSPLRLVVLPCEYNLMHTRFIPAMGKRMAAPRLLHLTMLHEKVDGLHDLDMPFNLRDVMGETPIEALRQLIQTDRTLGAARSVRDVVGDTLRRFPKAEKHARKWWRKLR